MVVNALNAVGAAAGANGLNVTLDAQLVTDVKAISSAVKGALSPAATRLHRRSKWHRTPERNTATVRIERTLDRTCLDMKAVSLAHLKEVLEHGKAKSGGAQ